MSITIGIALLILFNFLTHSVRASSVQQTNTIYLNPFYRQSMSNNQNYSYTVSVTPTTDILSVSSAIVRFKIFLTPSVNFTVLVNNMTCNTPNFYVSTTYAGAGQGQIDFDCTNIINKYGNYTVTLKPSGANTGAVIGWLDLTYMDNPLQLITSGTEYTVNENGTVFARILDGNSRSINLARCNTTIYYPNKTYFVQNQLLTFLNRGNYFYDFITPNITGSYIVNFDCVFPSSIYSQNTSVGMTLGATFDAFNDILFFDNSNNLTINSAYLEVASTGSATGSDMEVKVNGNIVGHMLGKTPPLGNFTLNQSNFQITEGQDISFTNVGTGTVYIIYYHLYVNYTFNNPQQIIRGQNEIHVSSGNITSVGEVLNALSSFWDVRYAGATEYKSETEGQLIYQFLRTSSGAVSPIDDADFCNITAWYPNGTTILINNQAMNHLTGSYGLYVYNFTVPTTTGVYKSNVYCKKGGNTGYGASTFHVSEWIVDIQNNFTTVMNNQQTIYNYLQNMNSSIYEWFENTWSNQTTIYNYQIAMNQTMANYYINMMNSITSLNNSLTVLINTRFDNLQTDILNKYNDIMTAIYNLQQKWLDISKNLLDQIVGAGQSLNAIGDTLGISPNPECGIWDRMVGNC